MKKPEITSCYLVRDIKDGSSWGGFDTIKKAEDEIKRVTSELDTEASQYEIIREIIVTDVVKRGIS